MHIVASPREQVGDLVIGLWERDGRLRDLYASRVGDFIRDVGRAADSIRARKLEEWHRQADEREQQKSEAGEGQ